MANGVLIRPLSVPFRLRTSGKVKLARLVLIGFLHTSRNHLHSLTFVHSLVLPQLLPPSDCNFCLRQLLSIKENICAERPRKSYALQDAKKKSLYHQKDEIHSFPAMHNTLGSSLGRNGSKKGFSKKNRPKNSFLGRHDPG